MMFQHRPHPRTLLGRGPAPKVSDGHIGINGKIALAITKAVGSMWMAYAFAVIALIGLPPALRPGGEGIIAWIAQTFLQLVLLSVIMVGQDVSAKAADSRADKTLLDADAILYETMEIQRHLKGQDEILESHAQAHGPRLSRGTETR